MELVETLRKDLFAFTKNKDKVSTAILQVVIANIKNVEIEKGESLSEEEAVKELRREVKRLAESVQIYEKAGRLDLLDQDLKQMKLLEKYIPALMSETEIEIVVKAKSKELDATSSADFGRLIGAVMKEIGPRADGSIVSAVVKRVLSS